MDKEITEIEKLAREIRGNNENQSKIFLYDSIDSVPEVKGFFGTGQVWFLLQKPSTGKFPQPKEKMFYKLLKNHGFKNAHITDISKIRGKATPKIPEEELDKDSENMSWLKDEYEILKPKLVVMCGSSVAENVRNCPILKNRFLHVRKEIMTHYAYRFAKNTDRKNRVVKELKDLRKIADRMKID